MAPRKIGPKGMRGMQRTGNTISDADRAALLTMMGESGNTISDADRARLQAIKGSGKSISNADMARIQKLLSSMKSPRGKTDRQLMAEGMIGGGAAVPSKFKGFSKLPETVQEKMDPVAAKKYEGGGEVRGMGRAYMGAPRKTKIR